MRAYVCSVGDYIIYSICTHFIVRGVGWLPDRCAMEFIRLIEAANGTPAALFFICWVYSSFNICWILPDLMDLLAHRLYPACMGRYTSPRDGCEVRKYSMFDAACVVVDRLLSYFVLVFVALQTNVHVSASSPSPRSRYVVPAPRESPSS